MDGAIQDTGSRAESIWWCVARPEKTRVGTSGRLCPRDLYPFAANATKSTMRTLATKIGSDPSAGDERRVRRRVEISSRRPPVASIGIVGSPGEMRKLSVLLLALGAAALCPAQQNRLAATSSNITRECLASPTLIDSGINTRFSPDLMSAAIYRNGALQRLDPASCALQEIPGTGDYNFSLAGF
jgi:hypothetical protein